MERKQNVSFVQDLSAAPMYVCVCVIHLCRNLVVVAVGELLVWVVLSLSAQSEAVGVPLAQSESVGVSLAQSEGVGVSLAKPECVGVPLAESEGILQIRIFL